MVFTRRWMLTRTAPAAIGLSTIGCGYYRPERGDAYAPWLFPDPLLSEPEQIVHAGLLAANPHNTQPWLFQIDTDRIRLFRDPDRHLGAMDSLWREMHIGLGCCVENMVRCAEALGRAVTVVVSDDEDSDLVAELLLGDGGQEAHPRLFDAIAERRTNRGKYKDAPLPRDIRDGLRALADEVPDVHLTLLTGAAKMDTLAEATVQATEDIIADAEMLHDSDVWYRHSKEEIAQHRDGVTIDAQNLGFLTTSVGKMLARPSAEEGGAYWLKNTEEQVSQASAFAVLSTPQRLLRSQQVACGRLYQRLALWLWAEGLDCQPLNQLPERQDREQELGLPPDAAETLAALIGDDALGAQMLFRVGYAKRDTHHSPRRGVDAVVR